MLGWELPPYNSGGLGVACLQLCKALSKRSSIDIEFIVPYRERHDNIDFMRVSSATPQGVAHIMRSGTVYSSYKYVREDGTEEWLNIYDQQALYEQAVVSMIKSRQFDIVHAHDWLTFRAAMRVKEKRGVPVILHVHSVEADRAGVIGGGNAMVREIEGLSMLLADRVIAVSQHTKNCIIREYGIPPDKIEVVHNSIEPSDAVTSTGENVYHYLDTMKAHGYRVVVNVGRLTIMKGLPSLLRAAKEVVYRAPKTLFLIVGSGEQYYELIELAADLGIGANVLFTEFQRGKRWRDAFAIGDLFVMPSVSEPFGLTALEAVGYGNTPALVTKQSGVSEVLRNCLKVDNWDIDELANQITAVVQHDPLRDNLIANARREYEKLSWHDASEKIERLYGQHLAGAAA